MATVRNKPEKKISRLTTANALKAAAISYYAHKGFSCYTELGVVPWGKRRLDVFAMNMKARFIGIECKSCYQDYKTDKKWQEYLPHCNQFYFLFTDTLYNKHADEFTKACKEHGAGILVLSSKSGQLVCMRPARCRSMEQQNKLRLLVKVSWRGGDSKRNHPRRVRVFIE